MPTCAAPQDLDSLLAKHWTKCAAATQEAFATASTSVHALLIVLALENGRELAWVKIESEGCHGSALSQ